MILKPDYNLENIYAIDLAELKSRGIKNLLFDLDSTIMASKSGCYSDETRQWLNDVRKNFFIAIVSNNENTAYIEKVKACTDFPCIFAAHKPDIKAATAFMDKHGLKPAETAFVGDRPLTDILCGKRLGCVTILVDSITAKTENLPTRFVRALERLTIKK